MPFPSTEHQFKPGNNANPAGRPPSRTMTQRLREALDQDASTGGGDVGDEVVKKWLEMVRAGDLKALTELVDRVDGLLVRSAAIQTDNETVIRVIYDDMPGYPRESEIVDATHALTDETQPSHSVYQE